MRHSSFSSSMLKKYFKLGLIEKNDTVAVSGVSHTSNWYLRKWRLLSQIWKEKILGKFSGKSERIGSLNEIPFYDWIKLLL